MTTNYFAKLNLPCGKVQLMEFTSKYYRKLQSPCLSLVVSMAICSLCISCTHTGSSEQISMEGDNFPLSADILIADNTVYQNNRAGIQIRGDTPVKITDCEIHYNGRAGINLADSANTLIEDSNLFNNGTSGIVANNPLQVTVKNSLLHQNHRAGIRIRKNEKSTQGKTAGTLINNKIFLNERGGVHAIANGPYPVAIALLENEIYRNQEAGVRVEDNIHLTAFGNELYRNGTSGIASYITADQSPVLDVFQNKIYFNRGAGIFVHSGVTGDIGLSNNWIYNNYLAGISCGLWDGPELEKVDVKIYHNTIVSNGSNVGGAGIRNLSSGRVIIKNNVIAYNFTSGINTSGCRGISYNLLFANGDTSMAPADTSNRTFIAENEQYSGCSGKQWGDILADPLFLNPDRYDFSLQDGSPANSAADSIDTPYFNQFPNQNLGAYFLFQPADAPGIP